MSEEEPSIEFERTLWERLTPAAKLVFILMLTVAIIGNVATSGLALGVIQGFVAVLGGVFIYGLPIAFLVSKFTKNKESVASNAVLFTFVTMLLIGTALFLFIWNEIGLMDAMRT